MKRITLLACLLGLVAAEACGPPASKPFGDPDGAGGSSGGLTSTGGITSTGGTIGATGGATATGGAPGAGGHTTGGMPGMSTGGAPEATGGHGAAAGTGGGGTGGLIITRTGGAPGTGGAMSGGSPGSGGVATGGATGGSTGGATGGVATGGTSMGGTGGNGSTCSSLASDYQTAVNNAKSCTTTGTCDVRISTSICGCSGCPSVTYISDSSGPDKIVAAWKDAGCSCPKVLCLVCANEPTGASCTSTLTTAAAPISGGGTIVLPRSCQDK